MDKSQIWKIILIIVLVVVSAWTLYPASKTLKPGIDLAGGTSLIYQIDTQGLEESEKREISERMITVLRRRIDPASIQNLVWRPQGSTRFEIQMPLASEQSRQRRQNFEEALSALLERNTNPAVIMRCLTKAEQERAADFERFAMNSPARLEILEALGEVYDQRKELQKKRDELAVKLETPENIIKAAGLNLDQIRTNVGDWIQLDEEQLAETLTAYLGSEGNLELLTRYVNMYSEWAHVVEQLTDPDTGKNIQYDAAMRELDKLNLTEEQLNFVMETPAKSPRRQQAIEELKTEFSDRADLIDKVVMAFDEYYDYRGRLDDSKDLQRMLKGAGILEFRILPTIGHAEVDTDEMSNYVELLKTKGPKYASDKKYAWCEIENMEEWKTQGSVFAQFGDKFYVLASNKREEVMLHGLEKRQWKLERAEPSRDRMGRRAIAFSLDERGGLLFSRISGKNIGRPLCILLDGIAISAPTLESRIYRHGIITGTFTETQVNDMVNKLNAGSLPARLIEQPISVKTIGPSIGADNRDQGIKAGLIGLGLVVLCMVAYYRFAGFVASLALLMNLLLVLAAMVVLRATFTLPGIAGIILTIGMSVDANVLIFERIREEQQKGSSLRIAIRNGYQRAFRTILDANLTTFITAAILYWVASEEIKGFAIVLMLGIILGMFTALFVTRTIFDLLLDYRVVKDRLSMAFLIRNPNMNWMAARGVFFTISALLVAAGLYVFFTRDDVKNNKYDIEFTGGTSVQINLKDKVHLSRADIEQRMRKIGDDLKNPALGAANVYSVGKGETSYEINTTETNKTSVTVRFAEGGHTAGEVAAAIKKAQSQFGGRLSNLLVSQKVDDLQSFVVATSQVNKSLVRNILVSAFSDAEVSEPQVDEIVSDSILSAFAGELEIQENLEPKVSSTEKITGELIETYPELTNFLGGIKISCEIKKAATGEDIDARFRDLRFKPDMRELNWYNYKLLDSELNPLEAGKATNSFVYVSTEPEAGFRELTEDERERFVGNETTKVLSAGSLETSLPRVTQIDPSVGAEAKTRALIAIVLSLFAIVAYIWVRFGNLRYGIAANVALIHDVCITLGAVTACTYLASTVIGEKLLIGDFKISLAMIAAFLTIIGYSLNDTIVVFDRIRENRHKAQLIPATVTNSINQTLSRTLLTSFTTFIVVLIMYIFGGQALRGFTFAIGFGIIIGTYSSIAIAAPILLLGMRKQKQ